MAVSLSSPVTGVVMSGFTAPTYTVIADNAPSVFGKQWSVSALGGTQAGVIVGSVAAPFTCSFFRPPQYKVLGKTNPVTGLLPSVPKNQYKAITRKGVLPLAGQPYSTMLITTTIDVPAGADTADAANVKAAFSLHIGALSQIGAGFGDTALSGVL